MPAFANYGLRPCKDCGDMHTKRDLSKQGLCSKCTGRRIREAGRQMHEKRGPVYEKWLRRMAEWARDKLPQMLKDAEVNNGAATGSKVQERLPGDEVPDKITDEERPSGSDSTGEILEDV